MTQRMTMLKHIEQVREAVLKLCRLNGLEVMVRGLAGILERYNASPVTPRTGTAAPTGGAATHRDG